MAPWLRFLAASLLPAVAARPSAAARCAVDLWLYESAEWAPPGYHVLCISDPDSSSSSTVNLWRGGHPDEKSTWQTKIKSLSGFRKQLEKRAKMEQQEMWEFLPWLLSDASGVPVTTVSALRGLLLVFEGGRWVWPGIREGFVRQLQVPSSDTSQELLNLTLKTLTLDPLAFIIEDFFDKPSAQRMIDLAEPKLKPAEILTEDAPQERKEELVDVRTCWEAWLSPSDGPDLGDVAVRTAALVRVPRELQEPFRVLRYLPGQHFAAHTDYYEPEDFQNQPEVSNELQHGRNWLVTVYLYLSNVAKGGATYFPSTYGRELPSDVLKCEGPSVKPRRGRALLFYSLHPNGTPNLSSMHGACKVEKGVKYTINIWTFNQLKPEATTPKKGKGHRKRKSEELR